MLRVFYCALFLIPNLCLASGLAIHPMEQFVSPSKAGIYYASNNLEKAIAVEVICESWRITEDGREVREVTNDLVAEPSQFILKGSTYRKVRVALRKPQRAIPQEQCYRVTIQELPISLEPAEAGTFRIQNASAYRTSYYVLPDKKVGELEVKESRFEEGKLTFSLYNSGNIHVHLRNPLLRLTTAKGEVHEVSDLERLKPINGENMHAQITRRFSLDLSDEQIPKDIVSATLELIDYEPMAGKKLNFTW